MIIVFDTNTLISAVLFSQSVPRQAFDLALERGTLISSEACLSELVQVLHRPKFTRYITPFEADLFINQYSLNIKSVLITSSVDDCRDAKDNKFLALAIDGHANCIVSGDSDLLVLNPYQAIPIFNPNQFIEWCNALEKI